MWVWFSWLRGVYLVPRVCEKADSVTGRGDWGWDDMGRWLSSACEEVEVEVGVEVRRGAHHGGRAEVAKDV